jgi:hypothetical protein
MKWVSMLGKQNHFIITVGDNIYNTGVTGTDDPNGKHVLTVYSAPSFRFRGMFRLVP